MTTSPTPADRSTPTRRFALATLLALVALLALGSSSALADAGNPIVGTTKGDLVKNPDGTVTAYVRGQWNWLSHGSDCNFDRAATGLSMVWNDSTETGYTLTNGSVSAQVGVNTKDGSWADPNPVDGMVHPVDRGNIPEGLPGVTIAGGFKADQAFVDPEPQAAGQPHPTATWRGGCGREPLSHVDAYTGFPWGSWGYEKESEGTDGNIHLGYSHVYRSLSFVPKSVCVNFYDVHGGAKESDKNFLTEFQVPKNTDKLDVLANDDNSIVTNAFNVNGGSCVHFAKITTSAKASAKLGEQITDTAQITDAFTDETNATDGEVTFKAYKDLPTTCTGAADFTSGPTAVDLDASTEVTSEPFTPSSVGTYYWVATYHSTADPQAADISTTCKEAGETSVVNKASPTLTTDAGPGVVLGGQVSDTAHLSGGVNPTGTITFRLYDNPNCAGTPVAELTNSSVNGNGDYASPQATPPAAGDYYWVATYSGDANNDSAQTGCADPTEKVTITSPPPNPPNPPAGGTAGVKKAAKVPPPECKLRKARARVFIYTRHNRVRLVIRYVAFTRATVTTSYTLHGRKGDLYLGKATKTFKKKGVFRLPKKLTPKKMKKVRAATEFGVQFQIPGTPKFCERFFKRKLTVARFVEGQKVWFQTGSVFGGDV